MIPTSTPVGQSLARGLLAQIDGTTYRAYLRCSACLHIFAIESATQRPYPGQQIECGGCGGTVEFIGNVGRDPARLTQEVDRVPCDARCTHAMGPICNCPCGGVNHGTRRVVTVTVDVGSRPRIIPQDAADCQRTRTEWETARDAALAAIAERFSAINNLRSQRWLNGSEWAEYSEGQRRRGLVVKARAMKTQRGRMQKLAQAIDFTAAT
jgi:hypothetical protein